MPRPLAVEILDAIVSTYRSHRAASGQQVDRSFDVGEFDRLEIAGPFGVEVRTGVAPSVTACGPEDALDCLSVEDADGRLSLGCDGDCDADVTVTVTMSELLGLRMTG